MKWMLVVIVTMSTARCALCDDEVFRKPDGSVVFVRSSHDLLHRLAMFVYLKEEYKKKGGEDLENFDRTCLHPVIEQLEENAARLIPTKASEQQREKLRLAASIDARRKLVEIRGLYEDGILIPKRFREWAGNDGKTIFASESLFEKVMRQQGLLDK